MVELADYDLALKHKPEKENKIADALSRRPDYDTEEDDNKGVVILPEMLRYRIVCSKLTIFYAALCLLTCTISFSPKVMRHDTEGLM